MWLKDPCRVVLIQAWAYPSDTISLYTWRFLMGHTVTSPDLSAYKYMWLFAMFDLPVDTDQAKKEYTRFRKTLLDMGFWMMQYSVYARFFASEEATEVHRRKIRHALPPDGEVRLLSVTDRQFGKMENYIGKKRKGNEKAPEQLLLF